MISKPTLGRLAQGLIFNCARAENYPNCRVFGLIITARCDISQNKVATINYVPVVSLDDWLCGDGFDIFVSLVKADLSGRQKSIFGQNSIANSILNSVSIGDVVADLRAESGKAKQKAADDLEAIHLSLSALTQICGDRVAKRTLLKEYPKLAKRLFTDLVRQSQAGYYYFPSSDDFTDDVGFVALLREPTSMPIDLAKFVARGLQQDDAKGDHQAKRFLDFSRSDFAMPVAQLNSPYIEHLMQTFSMLFSRIGLPDLSEHFASAPADRYLEK